MPKLRLFILATTIFIFSMSLHAPASAQDLKATHMWIDAGDPPTFVPVRTLKECENKTRQMAIFDHGAESHCYDGNVFIGGFKCEAGRKVVTQASCQKFSSPDGP